jgi:hypothetical protein
LLEERLREFMQGMLFKLDKNSHKHTPETADIPKMVIMLLNELEEFQNQFETDKHDPNTLVELFDVANFAFLMFLALRNRGHADWRNTPGETPVVWENP